MSETVNQAKERLQMYSAMQRDIDNQIERLERLQAVLGDPAAPSLSGMPRGGSGGTDKIGRKLERIDELETEIREAIERETREKAELEELICQLRDPDERAVLRMRYFDREGWGEIAEVLYSLESDYGEEPEKYQKRIFRIHGNALFNLGRGVNESKRE